MGGIDINHPFFSLYSRTFATAQSAPALKVALDMDRPNPVSSLHDDVEVFTSGILLV